MAALSNLCCSGRRSRRWSAAHKSCPVARESSPVVSANGDVSVCELHEPLGNLRQQTFPEIWHSEKADAMRASIARKECHCTTEVFLWPSIVFQPTHLLTTMANARVWQRVKPIAPGEKIVLPLLPTATEGADTPNHRPA